MAIKNHYAQNHISLGVDWTSRTYTLPYNVEAEYLITGSIGGGAGDKGISFGSHDILSVTGERTPTNTYTVSSETITGIIGSGGNAGSANFTLRIICDGNGLFSVNGEGFTYSNTTASVYRRIYNFGGSVGSVGGTVDWDLTLSTTNVTSQKVTVKRIS